MEDELRLETDWKGSPDTCEFLADVIIFDANQKRHLVRTSMARRFLTLDAVIDSDSIAVTVLGGKVQEGCHGLHISVPPDAFALSHRLPTSDTMANAIELCSGLGALGEGLEHNGFTVKVRNELRQPYAQLMQRQGFDSTIVGDIGSNEVIALIHQSHGESSLHAAGFPCQPWSPLGDQLKHKDFRGKTLHSILRAAFFLRAHTILLECVKQARDDTEIIRLLYKWCKVTGFNAREGILDLHTVWPAKRTRWWILLSFPGWIISLHLWANHDHSMDPISTPEHTLWLQLDRLLADRNAMFPVQQYGTRAQEFTKLLRDQLSVASQSRRVAKGLYCSDDIAPSIGDPVNFPEPTQPPSPGAREIIAHEEKSPASPAPFESDDRAIEDPYECEDDGAEDLDKAWDVFQQVSPDAQPAMILPKEEMDEPQDAKTLWQQVGAVPGFSNHVSQQPEVSLTATWIDTKPSETTDVPIEPEVSPTAHNASDAHEHSQKICINVSSIDTHAFVQVRVHPSTTIQDVLQAENRLQLMPRFTKATDPLGQEYSAQRIVEENMWLILQGDQPSEVSGSELTRIQQLYQQGAMVATDEMMHYLHEHPYGTKLNSHGVLGFEPTAAQTVVSEQLSFQLAAMLTQVAFNSVQILAVVHKQHWIPFVIDAQGHNSRITTTPAGAGLLRSLEHEPIYALPDDIVHVERDLPVVFRSDCGFQCKIWLLNVVGRILEDSSDIIANVTPDQAVQWRLHFHSSLLNDARGLIHHPYLITGGMLNQESLSQNLEHLLAEHGVPRNLCSQRAVDVINQLGRQAVLTCLRSSKPWRDFKAKSNAHVPKLQLVLPGELDAKIQERIKSGPPIKSKKKLDKMKIQKPKVEIQVQPEDIQVPDGIFQSGSVGLSQIQINQIGAEAQGIVLTRAVDAQPYLTMQKPISSKGLALVILDHTHDTVKDIGYQTRFPARCKHTQEPMILSAKLVQLGQQTVNRSQPTQTMRVEESETVVLRVVAYQDELSQDWHSFCDRPVKHILQELGLQSQDKHEDNPVVDVWDRQWLTLRMTKTSPQQSAMYMVNLRLTNIDLQQILTKSGEGGLYLEPRDETGRNPNEGFRVVWLPQMTKGSMQAAIQTSPQWAAMVRHGLRYGLRTNTQHAEQIHNLHKPKVPYLHSSQLKTFAVGPMPFNCTRSSLGKMFDMWSWKARAIQPRGRSSDGSGVMWTVQAEKPPVSQVFQMGHGDVIVTEDDEKKSSAASSSTDVMASAKTVAALRAKPLPAANPQSDPWESYDPWQKHPRISPPELSTQQLKALEDRMTERISTSLNKDPPDAVMSSVEDGRVSALETRMQMVEQTLQQHAHTQQQHHAELTQGIAQVQQNLDGHKQSMHQLLDNRFNEQLHHLERLLKKRTLEEEHKE
eukprot:Skav235041  [mRNA]  locus=scaffold287:267187:271838:- [translate_table: standard]